MLGSIIGIFIVHVISFGLFFFAVPYCTGKEMSKISDSGYYQFFYNICGSIGDLLYKLIQCINNGVAYILNLHPGSIWLSVINTGAYVLLIAACNEAYTSLMISMIHIEPGEFNYFADSSFAKFSNIWVIFCIVISQFSDVSSIGMFFSALGNALFAVCFFIVITLIYFSILFGALKEKLHELHLIKAEESIFPCRFSDFLELEISLNSVQSLFKKILQGILKLIDDVVLLRNFLTGKAWLVFIYLMLMFSCIEAYSGKTPSFLDLLMDFLDGSDIVNTVGSFVISFLLAKAAAYGCHKVYETLPEAAQQKIDATSERLNKVAISIQKKQQAWAEQNDAIYAASEGIAFSFESRAHKEPRKQKEDPPAETKHSTERVEKMNLERK